MWFLNLFRRSWRKDDTKQGESPAKATAEDKQYPQALGPVNIQHNLPNDSANELEHLPNENSIRQNPPNSPNGSPKDLPNPEVETVSDPTSASLTLVKIRKADVLNLLGSHVQETNVRLKDLEGRLAEIISRVEMRMAKEETLAEVRKDLSESLRCQEDRFKTSVQKDLDEARKRISNAKVSIAKHQILEAAREKPVNNRLIVELGIVKHLSTASSYLNELAQMGLLERQEQGKYRTVIF